MHGIACQNRDRSRHDGAHRCRSRETENSAKTFSIAHNQIAGRTRLTQLSMLILRVSSHSKGTEELIVEIMEQLAGHAGPAIQQVSSSPSCLGLARFLAMDNPRSFPSQYVKGWRAEVPVSPNIVGVGPSTAARAADVSKQLSLIRCHSCATHLLEAASIWVPFYCTANSDEIDPILGPRSALNRGSLLDPQSLGEEMH